MRKKKIKVQTPAKINLSLEIINRTENCFHTLSSVMQSISLFDFLTLDVEERSNAENEIILHGNLPHLPYDEKNIVFKALKAYFEKINAKGIKAEVNLEKNIPIEAGLAGGSTNAAGILLAINAAFNEELKRNEIHEIAATLGSDLNFCLEGGACILSSRGEIIDEKLPFKDFKIALVKPKNISISTAQCYKDFSKKYFIQKQPRYSQKIAELFKSDKNNIEPELSKLLYNDLEKPAIDMYFEIQKIKDNLIEGGCINALMSGSGSSVFGLYENEINLNFGDNFETFQINSISDGVKLL